MKLVPANSPILRLIAKRVGIFDDSLRQTARKLIDLMHEKNGIGIAAPQVGISKRLIIVSDGVCPPTALVNPVITMDGGSQTGLEGCLTFPGLWREVTRFDAITVKYQNLSGQFMNVTTTGLLSRCIQHEIDHLDGILFTDLGAQLVTEEIL